MTDLLDQALDQDVPLRVDLVPDWDEVLARAHVERASRPRRRRVLSLSLAAAGVSVVAVSTALALWPSGKGGVLERARAAVGSGPVIHVVFRDEVHETLVDLSSGRRTPLYEEHEQWYDAGRGLREVVRFNGHVQSEQVYGAGNVPPQAVQTYAGIFDGYRRGLDEGTATIRGEGTLDGRRVIWIHLKGERLIDVGDGKSHEWTHEIAIDARTYRPVYVREARDGVPGPGTGQAVLSVETLPARAADFSPVQERQLPPMFLGIPQRAALRPDAPEEAKAALGTTALWLGASYGGLPLVRVERQTLHWGPVRAPLEGTGIELCYGRLGPGLVGTTLTNAACDVNARHVLVQEARQPTDVYTWNRGGVVAIPRGSLLLGWGAGSGYLVRDGVYVHIAADSEAAVLAAARALEPWAVR